MEMGSVRAVAGGRQGRTASDLQQKGWMVWPCSGWGPADCASCQKLVEVEVPSGSWRSPLGVLTVLLSPASHVDNTGVPHFLEGSWSQALSTSLALLLPPCPCRGPMVQYQKRQCQYLSTADHFTSYTTFLKILMISVSHGVDSSRASSWQLDYSSAAEVLSTQYLCDFSPYLTAKQILLCHMHI